MHNLITFLCMQNSFSHKYTNFIIQFKRNVTKCLDYDKQSSYQEK